MISKLLLAIRHQHGHVLVKVCVTGTQHGALNVVPIVCNIIVYVGGAVERFTTVQLNWQDLVRTHLLEDLIVKSFVGDLSCLPCGLFIIEPLHLSVVQSSVIPLHFGDVIARI